MLAKGIIFFFVFMVINLTNCNPLPILLPTAMFSTAGDALALNKQTSMETKSFFYDSIKADKNPVMAPEQIPIELIPKDSKLLFAIKLNNDRGYFLDVEEVVAIVQVYNKIIFGIFVLVMIFVIYRKYISRRKDEGGNLGI